MTRFAKGGTMPMRPLADDEVPAMLSPGHVYVTQETADALAAAGITSEMIAALNSPAPSGSRRRRLRKVLLHRLKRPREHG